MEKTNCIYLVLETYKGIDFFNRLNRKLVVTDTLNELIENEKITVYVWLLMSDKLYLVVKKENKDILKETITNLKQNISKKTEEVLNDENDDAANFYLEIFRDQQTGLIDLWNNNEEYVELTNNKSIDTIIEVIHNIPVTKQVVRSADEYIFSSAADFHGFKGLVEVDSEF